MAEQTKLQVNIDQNPVGFVKKLTGQSIAVSSTGAERALQIGDSVYSGDKVVSKSGEMLVEFTDGSSLNMGPNDQTLLADDVIPARQDSVEISETVTDLSTIHHAIQAGADPSQVTTTTAAGIQQASSDSDEGSYMVEMARDGHETIAKAGFGTGDVAAESDNEESTLTDTASEIMKSSEASGALTSTPSNTTGKPSTTDPSTPPTTGPGTTDPSTQPIPPTVDNVELPAINEDSSIIIKPADLLANAKDPDGDSFSVTDLTLTNPTVGVLVDNGDGTWTFIPNKNYAADNVELGFTVTSTTYSAEAKATIDVIAVADAPTLSVRVNTQEFKEHKDTVKNPDGSIQLTAEENNKHGTAWSEDKIDLAKDFTLNFQLNFGNKDSTGADGIVFVLQSNEKGINAVGKSGGGLGFEGLDNSFGVEFDTWKNKTDHDEDHAAFVNGGYVKHDKELTSRQPLDNIEDGKWHDVQITWNASEQRITYKFTNQTTGKVTTDSIVRDIVNKDLGGSTEAWFGFTASTGGSNNKQSVRNVELHDSTISLDIKVAVTDDSEALGDVIISQVPTDVELSAGTNNNDGSWTLKQAELKDLFLDTQHYSGDKDFRLVVQAASSEKNGSTAATLQVINIEVNGKDAVASGATVVGTQGHDVILGGVGDDIIFASAGNDSLTGNDGADQFIWNKDAAVSGTVANPIEDHITDFNKDEDVLNLKDLLEGENVNTIDDYLAINFDGKSTTIEVSPMGDNQAVQKVVLDNVDLFDQYSTPDSQSILQNMITDGTLIIDQ
ncbi:retention module-containing protein [Spartinivicinus poritis]|uniref:Retention module-containing protein n=1 Tax=Spartinivicinus poritis TaxID=2994640 RepID=A0ABT5UAC0_9GAMM|nr:retention module-containing protein [Spartinivicinus sp. A2-2]MDE1463328.1 retention module-containing protein [Spartinivicinus sp. A2-2]